MIQQSHSLGIYPEKTIIQKITCKKKIHAPSVPCSTIYHSQDTWKQPKYPPTGKWIEEDWIQWSIT